MKKKMMEFVFVFLFLLGLGKKRERKGVPFVWGLICFIE